MAARECEMKEKRNAVVLLSGGLDSATTLAIAKAEGFSVYALSVSYGQRHAIELDCAARLSQVMDVVEHRVMRVDFGGIGGSALTADLDVPIDRSLDEMNASIPVTYVPARNTVLLSCALAYAETMGAWDIFAGVNALDYAGYPDCRPEYIRAFETMAQLATKQSVESSRALKIHVPLIQLTKSEIIARGAELQVPFDLTSTCYKPASTGEACGRCDACLLRREGFREAGIPDPTRYIG